jgi:uncharacterized protein YpmS
MALEVVAKSPNGGNQLLANIVQALRVAEERELESRKQLAKRETELLGTINRQKSRIAEYMSELEASRRNAENYQIHLARVEFEKNKQIEASRAELAQRIAREHSQDRRIELLLRQIADRDRELAKLRAELQQA